MCTTPESVPPGLDENGIASPESLPPGFESPSPLPNPTSQPLEKPVSSIPSPCSPSLQCQQVSPTHPSLFSNPTSPKKIQSYNSPPKQPQENCGPLPHSAQFPPAPSNESPVSLSPPPPSLRQEVLNEVSNPAVLPPEIQCPSPSLQLPQGNPSFPPPPPLQPLPEMGQMVCGNCNELLSYPRGRKYIQCACCQTTNFVLEAHQVGIVNCGKCALLLMYPFTAKSLRCSSCYHVTEIGPHNIKPPVSVLQGFPDEPQNGVADLKC